jgi:hypothetical protein
MSMESHKETSEKIQTTIGDLIAAISEIALKAGKTEAEGYHLASLTLQSILRKNQPVSLNAVIQ